LERDQEALELAPENGLSQLSNIGLKPRDRIGQRGVVI
jgi:hypothetical protein